MLAIGIRSLVLALLLSAGLVAAQARADVIYQFVQTNSTVPGAVASITLIGDNSFSFVSGTSDNGSGGVVPLGGPGFKSLAISFSGAPTFSNLLGSFPPIFCAGGLIPCVHWSVGISGDFGSVFYNDTQDEFGFNLTSNGVSTGFFNTDRIHPCHSTGACQFTGIWEEVPEPGSLGLLTVGMAGVLVLSRRRIGRPELS
jgi:hypothetical protein